VRALVGTSGWQYAQWRGDFYPAALPTSRWLEHYAEQFSTVEVNNTFYRLPEAAVFESWRQRVPEDFCFAVKASRYLTHVRRLADPGDPVGLFMDRARQLRTKLGPVLLQLPPTLRVDSARLDTTLRAFPGSVRVAVEPRHESWFVDEVEQLLGEHGAVLALTDRGGRPQEPVWRTADWAFIRFHGGRGRAGNYGIDALRTWAGRIRELGVRDAYVYFNNDTAGHAPRNARTLRSLLAGLASPAYA
jgi:uncharacterized protein YecE (DUF72 family)